MFCTVIKVHYMFSIFQPFAREDTRETPGSNMFQQAALPDTVPTVQSAQCSRCPPGDAFSPRHAVGVAGASPVATKRGWTEAELPDAAVGLGSPKANTGEVAKWDELVGLLLKDVGSGCERECKHVLCSLFVDNGQSSLVHIGLKHSNFSTQDFRFSMQYEPADIPELWWSFCQSH